MRSASSTSALFSKVYFPRLIVPLAAVLDGLDEMNQALRPVALRAL